MASNSLFASETPVLPKRGIHLDLKGVPPTAERLFSLLEVFAAARYNVVLVEWEDTFPWTVDERFRSPTAYTVDAIRRFVDAARRLHIEIIPLVQCLGHMETPLRVPGYEHLLEDPDHPSTLNVLAPGARELVQKMIEDVLEILPDVRHFHLGGDEAWEMGTHPDTKSYIEKHGKASLYLHHVEPILESLNSRGIRPILWHDMMIHWSDDALQALGQKCDLMVWGYRGHPDTTANHFNTRYIRRFHENRISLWGATAYKGSGHNNDRPDVQKHQENAQAWAEVAQRFQFQGVIATAWSRTSTNCMQYCPIDAALDSLINVGFILHDGQPPAGGSETCARALEELGEYVRFEQCKATMERLTEIRQRGWGAIQALREFEALRAIDPRRRGSFKEQLVMRKLRSTVQEFESIEKDMKERFSGLLDPIWIEEYLATRLVPIREELHRLECVHSVK